MARDKTRIRYVDWKTLHRLAAELAMKIRLDDYKPNIVYAVLKGGLIPARIIGDLLGVEEIGVLGVKFYYSPGMKRHKPVLTIPPTPPPRRDHRILVIDDIIDSGKTMQLVIDEINRYEVEIFRTASIYYKPWSIYKPDYYIEETRDWVIYPWELGESLRKGIMIEDLDDATIDILDMVKSMI